MLKEEDIDLGECVSGSPVPSAVLEVRALGPLVEDIRDKHDS